MQIEDVRVGANRLRSLRDDQIADLMRSIGEVGLLHPIVVDAGGKLIAGHHRLEACRRLGWDEIAATVVNLDAIDAEIAEIDENLFDPGLTVLERADHLARRKELYERKHPETRHGGAGKGRPKSRNDFDSKDTPTPSFADDTAAKTKASKRTVEQEVKISQSLTPEVKEAIRGTELEDRKVDLIQLSRLPAEEQRRAVDKVLKGEARNVKKAVVQEQHVKRREAVGIPDGQFLVITADPPWAYNNSGLEQSAADHFDTLPASEIAIRWADEVKAISTPRTVLFLWATSPLLPEGIDVLRAWGFEYKASLVWKKDRAPGIGWWAKTKHELLLIGVKSDTAQPAVKLDSVIEAPSQSTHSRKPEVFHELIEQMYPASIERPVHLELFARTERPGWVRGLYNQDLVE